MDAHTLEKIEFAQIRELLAGFTHCGMGRVLARELTPASQYGLVVRAQEHVRQMGHAVEERGRPPLAGVHDVRELVRQAVPPSALEPDEFATIAETLAATQGLRVWFDDLPETCPLIRTLGERVGDFRIIADEIQRAIDPRGNVRDEASDKLRSIRRTIEKARQQAVTIADRLLRSSHVVRMLQYAGSTFHDDRVVFPLRAEHRGRLPGIVHRSSDSGATLFVEPAELVELNNSISHLRADESKEISRIIWRLGQTVHHNETEILRTLDALAELDLLVAKVQFGRAFSMKCPEINRHGIVRLIEARHPLLLALAREAEQEGREPHEVVPIDVRLGDDFDMLMVTGPNTGGKTVALTTIGLLTAMTQAGLPIPAEQGSTLPVFDDVLIDVGDEQSLQQSLSTFSAHMSHLLEMLEAARPRTLVLIDELGAGTDPEEGAALGRAVMEELLRVGCRAILTTHLGVLKAAAFTLERVENAAVEFDVETLAPRYRLLIGEPGNSNALVIAARLGLPQRIVDAARGHLSSQHQMLRRAIKGTSRVRRRAEQARKEAETAKREADTARGNYQKELETLQNQQLDFRQWTQRIAALRPGDPVEVTRFDRTGRIVRMELHRQRAVVSVGALDIEVPIAELRPVDAPAEKRA